MCWRLGFRADCTLIRVEGFLSLGLSCGRVLKGLAPIVEQTLVLT